MKLSKQRDEILKYMCKSYSESERIFFTYEDLAATFPEYSESRIFDACASLADDGFITVLWADNLPSDIALNHSAVIETEENTWLHKGYRIAKEIRSWF